MERERAEARRESRESECDSKPNPRESICANLRIVGVRMAVPLINLRCRLLVWFYAPKVLGKIIVFLGSVSESIFGGGFLFLGSCCGIVVFRWCFAYVFAYLRWFLAPKNAR